MDRGRNYRLHSPACGSVYEESGNNRAVPGFEEGIAEGTNVGLKDAHLLHQSRRPGPEPGATRGVGDGEGAAFATCPPGIRKAKKEEGRVESDVAAQRVDD